MAELLYGAYAADIIDARAAELMQNMQTTPGLAIVRVGERPEDVSYERAAVKRCKKVGIYVRRILLPKDADSRMLMATLDALNLDLSIHGILVLRPLPEQLKDFKLRRCILPEKDVDGCTDAGIAGVFENTDVGFAPCTAQAAVEILDCYGVKCRGKRVAVVGRSLVVGRPAAMLLMHRDATVTICHSKTPSLPEITREADIVVVCAGRAEMLGAEYFRAGQTVIDVGVNVSKTTGKLCGDVNFAEVEPIVSAITPVPRGVGSVTTSVLVLHTVQAALRMVGTASKVFHAPLPPSMAEQNAAGGKK